MPDIDPQSLQQQAVLLASGEFPPGWAAVSHSTYSRVAVNTTAALYYKEFHHRSPWQAGCALVRGSRAGRSQRHCAALLQAGFEAPIELDAGVLPGGGEYRITRAVAGSPLNHWLLPSAPQAAPATGVDRRRVLRALGTFVGRLHNTGFIAGDLQAGNILVAQPGEQLRFILIDNEHNRQCQPAPGKQLLHNLVQLNCSLPGHLGRSDRYRILQAWQQQMPEWTALEARVLADAVCRRGPAPRAISG